MPAGACSHSNMKLGYTQADQSLLLPSSQHFLLTASGCFALAVFTLKTKLRCLLLLSLILAGASLVHRQPIQQTALVWELQWRGGEDILDQCASEVFPGRCAALGHPAVPLLAPAAAGPVAEQLLEGLLSWPCSHCMSEEHLQVPLKAP